MRRFSPPTPRLGDGAEAPGTSRRAAPAAVPPDVERLRFFSGVSAGHAVCSSEIALFPVGIGCSRRVPCVVGSGVVGAAPRPWASAAVGPVRRVAVAEPSASLLCGPAPRPWAPISGSGRAAADASAVLGPGPSNLLGAGAPVAPGPPGYGPAISTASTAAVPTWSFPAVVTASRVSCDGLRGRGGGVGPRSSPVLASHGVSLATGSAVP